LEVWKLWRSYFEKQLMSLALMAAASSCGGVRRKKYSGQQEHWFFKSPMVMLLKTKKAPVLQLMLS
jgi:hypothetical protein